MDYLKPEQLQTSSTCQFGHEVLGIARQKPTYLWMRCFTIAAWPSPLRSPLFLDAAAGFIMLLLGLRHRCCSCSSKNSLLLQNYLRLRMRCCCHESRLQSLRLRLRYRCSSCCCCCCGGGGGIGLSFLRMCEHVRNFVQSHKYEGRRVKCMCMDGLTQ